VAADTALTFELVVRDGTLNSDPKTLTLTVRNVDVITVNAGADQTVRSGDTVKLQGQASDSAGSTPTYAWTLLSPEGLALTLAGEDTATPTFTAPSVPAGQQLALTFRLTATLGGRTAQDTVTVTVQGVNQHPVGQVPASFSEKEGTPIVLDASGSTDPEGDTLSFQWTQEGGPRLSLTGADTSKLSFTAPEVLADTQLRFVLVVTDAAGATSAPVPVTVTVLNVNKAPVAHARKQPSDLGASRITLEASSSLDPDGDALTYRWEQVAGPQVTLSSTTAPSVSFDVPKTENTTQLQFKLTVTDPSGASGSDVVEVLVLGDKKGDSGGCSSTGDSAGSLMVLSLLAGVLLSRRRTLPSA
jgi:large repetitive protein